MRKADKSFMKRGNATISYKVQILKLMQYASSQTEPRKEND